MRADGAGLGRGAHFHHQRKLFIGRVEFGVAKLGQGEGVERDGFADPAPFHHKVLALAGDRLGAHLVHRAGALQFFAAAPEPLAFKPVVGLQVLEEGAAMLRDIQVRAVRQHVMFVMHAEQGFALGGSRHGGGRWRRGCHNGPRAMRGKQRQSGTDT